MEIRAVNETTLLIATRDIILKKGKKEKKKKRGKKRKRGRVS